VNTCGVLLQRTGKSNTGTINLPITPRSSRNSFQFIFFLSSDSFALLYPPFTNIVFLNPNKKSYLEGKRKTHRGLSGKVFCFERERPTLRRLREARREEGQEI
jgi:hypothetical protein